MTDNEKIPDINKNLYIFDLDNTLYQYLDEDKDKDNNKNIEKINKTLLDRIVGKKIIFSNAKSHHIDLWLDILDIKDKFSSLLSCDNMNGFKPNPLLYKRINKAIINLKTNENVFFFDDLPLNLNPAKSLGWTTILITRNQSDLENEFYNSWIDYKFENINLALDFFISKIEN